MNDRFGTIHTRDIRSYLLGQLADEDQHRIEERLFTEDTFLPQVELAEDELIEAYARGGLSSDERKRFERHFLTTPERQRRLQLARSLRAEFAAAAPPALPPAARVITMPSVRQMAPWLALAACLAIFISLTGYLGLRLAEQRTIASARQEQWEQELATRDARLQQLVDELRAQREQLAKTEQNTVRLAQARPAPALEPLSFLLPPDVVMRTGTEAGQRKPKLIPTNAGAVELRLIVDLDDRNAYRRYAAVVNTAEGAQVWGHNDVRAVARDANTLVLRLPAGLLRPGEYKIQLLGRSAGGAMEEIDEYSLSVVQR
jgi:hypothetical protein